MSEKKKKLKFIIIGTIIFLLIIGLFFCLNKPDTLSEEFAGTYESGIGSSVVYFSADKVKNNEFFYTDQENQIYIKGKVIPITEDIYEITCDSLEAKDIIAVQKIQYQNQSFRLIASDQEKIFKKVDELPILFCDLKNYK